MILLEVVFLAVFWSWFFSAVLFLRNTYLPRLPLFNSPEAHGLPSDVVTFPATDGVLLEGWLIKQPQPGDPWVILCHGVGSNRSDMLDTAAGLYSAGFNLLLFDFRAHGGSGGTVTSFGWREQRDLEGALVFLGSQPEVPDHPVGVYGISMGGAVAIMVAARDERIGAIVADSPYDQLDESISRHTILMYPWLPPQPFGWFVAATYRLRFGVRPSHMSPWKAAAKLGLRPLLVIQGGRDPRMPIEGAQRIVSQAKNGALWMVPDAAHLESFSLNPEAYLSRLNVFFRQHLR